MRLGIPRAQSEEVPIPREADRVFARGRHPDGAVDHRSRERVRPKAGLRALLAAKTAPVNQKIKKPAGECLLAFVFLAPRPGLEPGTCGLTVSINQIFWDAMGRPGTR